MEHEQKRIPIDDEEIVELYWMREERAIRETDIKYGSYLNTVAYHIVHDALDCEECLNDTYMGAWNAMPPSRPQALKAFLTTIMRRVAVNRYHKNTRKKTVPSEMTVSLSELEELWSDGESTDRELDAARLGEVISEFLHGLSERERFVFISRYYLAKPIDAIAAQLQLSRSSVNKLLSAIRAELKNALEKEGYLV